MNIVNLTPHDVVVQSPDGTRTTYPKTGQVARVANLPGAQCDIPGIPVPVFEADKPGAVEGLPAPVEGTMYIVSLIVGNAVAGRRDILIPATGPADGVIRDGGGQVAAVTRFKRA